MIRKAIIAGSVAVGLGMLFFGWEAASYVRTATGQVKESVSDSFPTGFQIERARRMVSELVPEIRKNMHVIAKDEVEVERLAEKIATSEAGLAKDKEEIVRLKNDLASGEVRFVYASRTYSAGQVQTDLSRRFERYKVNEATLASLHGMHDARQRSLDAARQRLEGMLAAKRQLAVEIENIEARLQMVNAAKATSQYQFDDSQLGRAKELVSDLKTRLSVSERMLDVDGELAEEIPLDEVVPTDIVEQVTEYFAEEPEPVTIAAVE